MMETSKKLFVVFANTKEKAIPLAVFDQDNMRKVLGPICLNISKARSFIAEYEKSLRLVLDNKEPEVLVHARSQVKTEGFKSFKDLFASGFKEDMENFQRIKKDWDAQKEVYIQAAKRKLQEDLKKIKFFNKSAELKIARDPCSSISVEMVYWTNYDK